MLKFLVSSVLIAFTCNSFAQFPPGRTKRPTEKEITVPFMAPSPMVCGTKETIDKVLRKHGLHFTAFYAKSELVDDAISLFYFNETTKKFLIVRVYGNGSESLHCILEFGTQINSNETTIPSNFKHKYKKHRHARSSKVIMCGGGRYPCAVQKR